MAGIHIYIIYILLDRYAALEALTSTHVCGCIKSLKILGANDNTHLGALARGNQRKLKNRRIG